MFGAPVALVVSIVGLIKDRPKGFAVAGLVISALTCCILLVQLL